MEKDNKSKLAYNLDGNFDFDFDKNPVLVEDVQLFTMIKNEMDILPYFIRWYAHLFGLGNLHVIDNLSTDGSWQYLQSIKKKHDCFNLQQTPPDFDFINKKTLLSQEIKLFRNFVI